MNDSYLVALHVLGIAVIAIPTLLMILLGILSLCDAPISEKTISRFVQVSIALALLAALGVLGIMLATDKRHVSIKLSDWVVIAHEYHFVIKIVFDRLSVAFVILSLVLCGTIGSFATRYMHREPGFRRFFVLYALFVLGMVLASLADTIETLFAGWEMVGLSSALLVSFFQERPNPVRNGLWVWVVYRVSDAALLLAAVVLHHVTGEGDFDQLLGVGPWPEGLPQISTVTPGIVFLVGLLLLIAAAGKSALVPFSGWLPRAMEGPTPSSAVFYGALSVHLGAFLLLRLGPLLASSFWLSVVVVVLGLTTALFASLAGSVQTDIKSALSFASLTQVGIIVAEIGIGFRYIALVHLIGHACLRTLQFLRAPMLLQDYGTIENALGRRLTRPSSLLVWLTPQPLQAWLYRFALERGYLDAILTDWIVAPILWMFRWFDTLEHRWLALLNGTPRATNRNSGPEYREDAA